MGPYRHYSFESQTSQLEPSLFSNCYQRSSVAITEGSAQELAGGGASAAGKHPGVHAHPLVAVVERKVARTGAGGGCSSGGSVRTYGGSIRARRWLHSPAASRAGHGGPRRPWNERDTEQGGTQTMHELQLVASMAAMAAAGAG